MIVLMILLENPYAFFMWRVMQWQYPTGATMLSTVLIAILAVGVPFFLACIGGFLKDLKRYRNK